ncbi:MAG: dethiobiotin synthase [Candidatus Gastranaerophilales bacterium]|nr:dethiobiotin synthase [Candidatus Gastranaerophilales bacterium]
MNIFVTGIGNNSGKTIISAGISAVLQSVGYKVGVYKPVQLGAIKKEEYLLSPDLTIVKMLDQNITTHSTFMMQSKFVPTVSAQVENTDINLEAIVNDYKILLDKTNILITEATGGLMTPLKDGLFSYHIPLKLKLPVIFVVTPTTDSLNILLNEINTARTAGLDIGGIIINKFPATSKSEEVQAFPMLVEKYSNTKVLGIIRNFCGKSVHTNILINEVLNGIDLENVFRIKLKKLNSY